MKSIDWSYRKEVHGTSGNRVLEMKYDEWNNEYISRTKYIGWPRTMGYGYVLETIEPWTDQRASGHEKALYIYYLKSIKTWVWRFFFCKIKYKTLCRCLKGTIMNTLRKPDFIQQHRRNLCLGPFRGSITWSLYLWIYFSTITCLLEREIYRHIIAY